MKEFIDKLKRIVGFMHITVYREYGEDREGVEVVPLRILIDTIDELAEEYKGGWISAEYEAPPSDAYILLSFSNFSIPLVGRYEEDEYGGAFYIGDEDESCASQGVFVNAWQPLPDPYIEK